MSKQTPSDALEQLGADSKIAKFRAALPAIEEAKRRGASYASIRAGLAAAGIHMSANEFRVTLHRIKQAQQKEKEGHARHSAPPLPSPTSTENGPKRFNFNDHTHTQKREKW
ncbi:hypothetical protein HA052_22470 [Chromobacterium haemolyticum]|uniref:KfrA N-terminal DNA-binding domain-containing protein n=1 Tax=Chromobacterium fluminis TaxID=3044269 RepID=A0ABX0L809_9NEIS|nr:hypothetical protein [Chromobacterium haemolyticum]NHR07957.1 hypothetical protein [Chromobacterium haemolyticum]